MAKQITNRVWNYTVTEDGRVFSDSGWRGHGLVELVQHPNSDGYPSVRLYINGVRKRQAVHKLVAEKYLPARPSPEHEIRHLDGTKTNNHRDNLVWGTALENAADRQSHGRTVRGDKHGMRIKALRKA